MEYKLLFDAGQEHYKEHGADDASIEAFIKKIKKDKNLLHIALYLASYDVLCKQMREERATINRQDVNNQPRIFSREFQEAVVSSTRFMDWPMMDRKTRLKDADKEMLAKERSFYEKTGRSNLIHARFMQLVDERVSHNGKVSDVWSEEQLGKLYKRAEGEIGPSGHILSAAGD